MQQRDSDFFPLSYTMPNTVRKFADRNIYVKKDDLGENFDILQRLLCQNFEMMKNNGIELKITRTKTDEDWDKEVEKMIAAGFRNEHIPKKPYPKVPMTVRCVNVEDVRKAQAYNLTFRNGERIFFTKSGISASNGASITSQNARNLYADQNFETKLTFAIGTGDPQPLFVLLSQYSVQDRSVNNTHTRRNLYKKTQDNDYTATYTPVEQDYNMENFYQNAVDNYKRSPEARTFEIRDYENRSRPGGLYYEYEYDPASMCIRNPDIVGRAQVYQDIHEDNLRKSIKQKHLRRKPILQYDPWFDYYIRDITFPRPSYYVEYGSYLVPVYR